MLCMFSDGNNVILISLFMNHEDYVISSTVSCPVEVPPYSMIIDTLPVFESVNIAQVII